VSVDQELVAQDLREVIRGLVSEVLLVPRESVRLDSALIGDLGAESIDFVDLIFRIEDVIGRKIPTSRWGTFVLERFGSADLTRVITSAVFVEFAELERNRPA
jgi:acyl carrier protein